jgi:hypothetical protein
VRATDQIRESTKRLVADAVADVAQSQAMLASARRMAGEAAVVARAAQEKTLRAVARLRLLKSH